MDAEFWVARWERGQIGFHLDRVNPRLLKHWPSLAVGVGQPVFVPLCGKSLDMAWFARAGHPVTGIEFSATAIAAFFSEYGHRPDVATAGPFRAYEAANLRLLQGDFFELRAAHLPGVAAVYDRAALIALPPPMRAAYARHLAALLAPGTQVLLITLEYEQREMQGPPFAVHADEVQALYEATFSVTQLELTAELDVPPRFRERGLRRMRERIFRLQRRPPAGG